MMDKSFTFRTWNLNKINLPMFRSTAQNEEDIDFDGCCLSIGNPTNVKTTYYEAFAGEQEVGSMYLANTEKLRKEMLGKFIVWDMLLLLSLFLLTPSTII